MIKAAIKYIRRLLSSRLSAREKIVELAKKIKNLKVILYSHIPAHEKIEERIDMEQLYILSDENGITVSIPTPLNKCEWFVYKLYDRYMNQICTSGKTSENKYCLVPNENGKYSVVVKGYIGKNRKWIIRRALIDYFSAATRQEFRTFLEEESTWTLPKFQLTKMPYPFQNFAVHTAAGKLERPINTSFLKALGFSGKSISQYAEIIFDPSRIESPDCILSGIVLDKEGMRYGQEDLNAKACVVNDTQVGQFTYLFNNDGEIELGSDYFGIGRLYYYQYNEEWIITNNYMVLLLLMKDLGKESSLNYDEILSLMAKQNQISQQITSRNREIKGCIVLPVDQKIKIAKTGKVSLVDKSLRKILSYTAEKTNLIDESILYKTGIEEIKRNIQSIMKNPRFSQYSVDVTDGLDSRCVFGALKTLVKDKAIDNKNTVYVHTAVDKAHLKDAAIACRLNNGAFNWNLRSVYCDRVHDLQQTLNKYVSLIGGEGYFYPMRPLSYARDSEDAPLFTINGFFGEIIGRPYYSNNIRKDKNRRRKFIEVITYNETPLSAASIRAHRRSMMSELSLLPGRDLIEKYELHYLFYRNTLHFGCVGKFRLNNPAIGVLMSPSLFRLKHQDFSKWDTVEEQLELLDRMDPENLYIPFNKKTYERARFKYLLQHKKKLPPFQKASQAELTALCALANDRRSVSIEKPEDIQRFDNDYETAVFSLIRYLAKKDIILKEEVCLPMWAQIQANVFPSSQILCLLWKMLTLANEIRLFENK